MMGHVKNLAREDTQTYKYTSYIPKILLHLLPPDHPLMIDKIRHIQQLLLLFLFVGVAFHNRSRDDADAAFPRQVFVFFKVDLVVLGAEGREGWVIGFPVGEVVFCWVGMGRNWS